MYELKNIFCVYWCVCVCFFNCFRKMVSEGFNFSIIKSFISIFHEEANVLAEILQKKRDVLSNECDISVPISMATMEIIGRTALGVKFNAQNYGNHRFVENLQTAMLVSNYINEIVYIFN